MDSRFNQRDQKRKLNKIYNIAITIVSVLIIIVAATIFLSDDGSSDKAASESKQTAGNSKHADKEKDTEKDESKDSADLEDQGKEEDADKEKEDGETPELVEVEGSDGNVTKAYTSEEWEPVGTEQTGEHTTSYQKDSVDWNEMRKALAVGAGMEEGTMKLWWLENGGSPTSAIGTVSDGSDTHTYRVYIEWVDGSGWKPAKVEELKENDKKK